MDHARVRVLTELRGALQYVRELPDGIAGLAKGREVRIEHVAGAVVEWISLRTPICSAADMDPALVLERNSRLAFASIVLARGTYWLRISLPCDSAELADPRRTLALVLEAAASLVPNAALVAGDASPFEHFAS